MTVRVPRAKLDPRILAALLTPALLSPARDDAPEACAKKAGVAWLRWGDANHRDPTRFN